MPRLARRTACPLGIVALLAVVAHAQKPAVPAAAPAATAVENPLFILPEQRDSREQLRAVLDYLGRSQVPWDVVTKTAQRLLDAKSDSFYRVKDDAGRETGAVVSVKTKVTEILAGLPEEGVQFYEQEYGPPAQDLLKQAIEAGSDRALLTRVSRQYFQTKAGVQATLILAAQDLAAGRYAESAYHYGRVIDRPGVTPEPRVLLRAAIAARRAGADLKTAARWADLAVQSVPPSGVVVGRQTLSVDDVRQLLSETVAVGAESERGVVGRYNSASRGGLAEAGAPLLEPEFVRPLVVPAVAASPDTPPAPGLVAGAEWVRQKVNLALKLAKSKKQSPPWTGFFPVLAPGMVVYRTYDGVAAVSTGGDGRPPAGSLLWACGSSTDPAIGSPQVLFGIGVTPSVSGWWSSHWESYAPQILYENTVLGSLSQDGVRAYYVQDLAVPPPPTGMRLGRGQPMVAPQNPTPGSPEAQAEYSRLAAVNLATGRTEWVLGGPAVTMTEAEQESSTSATELLSGAVFLGPPVASAGRIYVAYEKGSQYRVACLEPGTVALSPGERPVYEPRLLWTQLIGEAASPAASDPLRRTQAAYLAVADGVLVCPTNAGTVVALDLNAQRLLWARNYKTAAEPGADPNDEAMGGLGGFRGGRRFPGGAMPPKPVPVDRWRAAAPIVHQGKVVVAAYDSDVVTVLDLRTGSPVWGVPRDKDDLAVGGVVNDTLIVVGRAELKGYALGGDAGNPKLLWRLATGQPLGHGAAGRDGHYYLPVLSAEKNQPASAQVVAVNAATGQLKPGVAFRRRTTVTGNPELDLGNIAFSDGLMVSQSPLEVVAFPLAEPMRKVMEARLKANPNDPAAMVTRAELELQDGTFALAAETLRRARGFNPPESVRQRLNQKLYTAYSELARTDFAAVEPHLADYQALCEVPADSNDPSERKRQLDEGAARRGLYLVQVATGRERLGQFADAYDAYRAYAATADDALIEVEGDPDRQARADLWARGRLDRMASSGPEAKAVVTAKIAEEWGRVRASGDRAELAAFVELFGGSTPAGRDAELALADELAASADDAASAGELLKRMAGATDDPARKADCLARLARLALDADDRATAAHYYQVLAREYADVPLGDSTAGAAASAALADRRMVAGLDPTRPPPPRAYRVQKNPAVQATAPSCRLSLDGELDPAYSRFDLTLELVPQDQSLVVRATDRATGAVAAEFTGIGPGTNPQIFRQGGGQLVPTSTAALASGSRVVYQLGTTVYCFDLAAKKEAWRLDLFAKPVPGNAFEFVADAPDPAAGRLRRRAVLTGRVAAFVTPDGLKAVDPRTGKTLWTRADLAAPRTIFGDDRHLFVESNDDGRVTVVAVHTPDGSRVEPAPDFSRLADGATVLGVHGRMVLTVESQRLPNRRGVLGALLPASKRRFALTDLLAADRPRWVREFPEPNSAVVRSPDPGLTGIVLGNGTLELFRAADGQTVFSAHVEAEVLKAVWPIDPLAVVDRDRVYLFLSKLGGNDGASRVGRSLNQPYPEVVPVNGPVVAFDRATGKRVWYNLDVFVNQRLVVERFDEVPVLIAMAATTDAQTPSLRMAVVAVDKRTGRVRYQVSDNQMAELTAVKVDPRTRAVAFERGSSSLQLVPVEESAP